MDKSARFGREEKSFPQARLGLRANQGAIKYRFPRIRSTTWESAWGVLIYSSDALLSQMS